MKKNKIALFIGIVAELGKVKITVAVSLSTILGYILWKGTADASMWLPTLGIFLLAMASSAINHYQERDYDALMDRTRLRPIPSGRISPGGALAVALALAVAGSALLWIDSGFLAMQLGLLALLWYNAIYTPLKRVTPFAVVPGSVIGAIPPMVGWVAAGGGLMDPKILMVAFFFFIWQIPHFWLLLLKLGPQYAQAGFPVLTNLYSNRQLRNITFVWTLTMAISCLFIPVFGGMHTNVGRLLLLVGSVALVLLFVRLLLLKDDQVYDKRYFLYINTYLLVVMVVLAADAVA
jgi:protoheme IX farnesyltransferase